MLVSLCEYACLYVLVFMSKCASVACLSVSKGRGGGGGECTGAHARVYVCDVWEGGFRERERRYGVSVMCVCECTGAHAVCMCVCVCVCVCVHVCVCV